MNSFLVITFDDVNALQFPNLTTRYKSSIECLKSSVNKSELQLLTVKKKLKVKKK